MKCPYCRGDNDRVIDTRLAEEGAAIRRRRHCLACDRRYTTYERAEGSTVRVVKKDGGRVPFQREKIRAGLEKACWKRPVRSEQIEAIVAAVENEVHATGDPEVESRVIGELVMDQLRLLDQVAYVRFASVYRDFDDARDFVDELQPMLADRQPHRAQGELPFHG